jgi:dienelactone hydrolase
MNRQLTTICILGVISLFSVFGADPPSVIEPFGTAPDGTVLRWTVFVPGTPMPQCGWPVALVLHVGGFKDQTHRGPLGVCDDLRHAGFVAIAIDYRLDVPANFEFNEPGRTPQTDVAYSSSYSPNAQTDDVRMAIHAARLGSTAATMGIVNGKVGAVGGSAGASHALYCAVTGKLGEREDRFDCATLLSGPYDYNDSTFLSSQQDFNDVRWYCGNMAGTEPYFHDRLVTESPVNKVLADFSPMQVFAGDQDTMPVTEYNSLKVKLDTLDPSFLKHDEHIVSGVHAFNYWGVIKNNPNYSVYNFLHTYLDVTSCPP